MAIFRALASSLGNSADFFTVIGVFTATIAAYKSAVAVFRFISTYLLSGLLGLSADLRKAGKWAVITGCTDGIGKAYAEQIAKKGINIVLISRTQSKLDAMAKEIESKCNVQTKTIAVDFTQTDIYDKIRSNLKDLDIGTLVNNVGMSYEFPEYFVELENRDKVVSDMLNVNILSCSMLTSAVLPGMVERKKGFIINISSTSATDPISLLTLYSATKAYVDFFSRGLQKEVSSKGITVQSVIPGFVATKLSKIRKSNFLMPTPSSFVHSALATVGIDNRTYGYWSHAIQGFVMNYIAPRQLQMYILLKARESYLRKKNRKKDS